MDLYPLSDIIVDKTLFQIRSDNDFKNGRENIDLIKQQLEADPKFDIPIPIWLWKDTSTEKVYLIDGFHRITAYKEVGRWGIPSEFKVCGEAKNVADAKFWVLANVNRHTARPLSSKDKKKLFQEYVLDLRNISKDIACLGEEFGISKTLTTRWRNELNLDQRKQQTLELLAQQGTVASTSTDELLEVLFLRKDLNVWRLFELISNNEEIYQGVINRFKDSERYLDLLDPDEELRRCARDFSDSQIENKGESYREFLKDNVIAYLRFSGKTEEFDYVLEGEGIELLRRSNNG